MDRSELSRCTLPGWPDSRYDALTLTRFGCFSRNFALVGLEFSSEILLPGKYISTGVFKPVVVSNALHLLVLVGKLRKRVLFLTDVLQAVWDALSPKSCDTHSTSYSATRETFLKLLRPGVDYRETFFKVRSENWTRKV